MELTVERTQVNSIMAVAVTAQNLRIEKGREAKVPPKAAKPVKRS